MLMLIYVFGIIVGVIISGVVFKIKFKKSLVGDLRIDRSDTFDGPYLFLELDKPLESITGKQYVMLKVKDEDFNPRK